MSEEQLQQIVGKASKLNELRRAKDRVRQLERELRGEPVKPQEPDYVPEFLRARPAAPIDGRRGPSKAAGSPGARGTILYPRRGDRCGPWDRRLV